MLELLSRRVAKALPTTEALTKAMTNKSLRVYLGIDPTATKLHLGHAIGIKKLMEFANNGHQAILLFGTGTVLVGDPSQRDEKRKIIDRAKIEKNIQTWKDQVAPIVDFSKVEIRQNGDWLNKLNLSDLVEIASHISATQLFKRESFTRRIAKGDVVWFHETLYPLLQGYDSVVMDVDLEIGGTDQEFNMLMGRELQKKMNNREKFVLTTPMIMGTDGNQMSKTSDNCIWLQDSPDQMYGKLMSIKDEQIPSYLTNVTDLEDQAVSELITRLTKGDNPKLVKEIMAQNVVSIWHGQAAADQASSDFKDKFERKTDDLENIPEHSIDSGEVDLVGLLVDLGIQSKTKARALISQNAISLNKKTIDTQSIKAKNGDILKVGKTKFYRLVTK